MKIKCGSKMIEAKLGMQVEVILDNGPRVPCIIAELLPYKTFQHTTLTKDGIVKKRYKGLIRIQCTNGFWNPYDQMIFVKEIVVATDPLLIALVEADAI